MDGYLSINLGTVVVIIRQRVVDRRQTDVWIVSEQFIRREAILQDVCGNRPDRDTSAGDPWTPAAHGLIGLDIGVKNMWHSATVHQEK